MILHCCQVDDVQTFRCHYGSSNQAYPRENSCFSTVHRLPLRELEHQPPSLPPENARTHTHTHIHDWFASRACNIPSSTPSSPLLNRHVIPLSSKFHVNQRLVAPLASAVRFDQVRRFPIFAHVFIRLTIRERGQSWSGEARINEPRKPAPPNVSSSSPFLPLPPSLLFKLSPPPGGFR